MANRSRDYINANYIDVSIQSFFGIFQFAISYTLSVKTVFDAFSYVIIIFKGLKKENQYIACQGLLILISIAI